MSTPGWTRLWALSLVAAALPGCGERGLPGQDEAPAQLEVPASLPTGDAVALGFDADRLAAIDAYLQGLVDEGALPGASLRILRRGQVAHSVTVGYSDLEDGTALMEDGLFRLASATKIWVSVAFMTLVDQGLVSLSDAVATFLPEFEDLTVFEDGAVVPSTRPMTILDLLRHTAGMGYGYEDPYQSALVDAGLLETGVRLSMDWSHEITLDEWAARLATVPLEDEPATRFSYGLSHDLLGLVIERITGEPLDRFMQDVVFTPMGLTGTGFGVPAGRGADLTSFYLFEDGALELLESAPESPFHARPLAPSGGGGWDQIGNGGMITSLGDFARFLQMFLNDGELDGVRILQPETVRLMKRNHLDGIGDGDSFWPGAGFGMGYAVLYDTERFPDPGAVGTMWWAGSTNTYFWVDPENQVVGVFLTHVLPFGHREAMDTVHRMANEAVGLGARP